VLFSPRTLADATTLNINTPNRKDSRRRYAAIDLDRITPTIRTLHDMKDVIFDRTWLAASPNIDLYFMYRDVHLSRKDHEVIKESGLRYDITVIPPRMLGCEYVKTAGHYHETVPGTGVSYPEIYEVLSGEALYFLQRQEDGEVVDAVAVRAGAGDKVLIPPGFGHVTINASKHVLKMANWVGRDVKSLYEPIREKAGAAYYFLDTGPFRNKRYGQVPELRYLPCTGEPSLGLVKSKEMYGLVKDISKLEFLTKPQDHMHLFESFLPEL